MTAVWYLGASDARVVYGRDWAAAGADPGPTTRWDRTNGYSLPTAGFTSSQLALLDGFPEFWITAPDGPRTFPVPFDEVVTFAGLNRYLADPTKVPGLNKSTVGLAHVDDTPDAAKPVSGPQATALAAKITAPIGGTAGQVVTANGDGTWGLSTPATGATVTPTADDSVPSGTTYQVSGTAPVPAWADVKVLLAAKLAKPPTAGAQGQVLQRDASSTTGTAWVTPASSGGGTAVGDATPTSKGIVRLGGDLGGTADAPTLRQVNAAAATYGSSTKVPQVTVDTAGRVTAVTEVAVATGTAGSGGGIAATVDGTSVTALAFTSGVTAVDVSALPLPAGTPALGQVPAVSGLNPLTTAWASPATGGGSGGSSATTNSTTLNVLAYGGKGDGAALTDLTVTAGSTTISSQAAPFTSTAADAGKLVIWLTGATTEVGTIATVQSTTQATLTKAAVANSVAFGGPNGNGALGTDNTAAITAALTAAQAGNTAAGANRRGRVPSYRVHLPGGVYLTKGGHVITQPDGIISGDGMFATYLVAATTSGTLFQHGTFNPNPGDAFQGTAFNWQYRDLHVMDATRISTGTEGQRTVNGIVDYGNGGIRIAGCRFTGLKYGFAGAYGSDFSDIRDSFFVNCDVCYYFGPGSQQVNISKTDCTDSRENAVFEGAPHWHIGDGSSFEDASVSSVTIEGKKNGTTRWGVSPSLGGAFYSGNFIIDGGVWFETNAGGNGRIAPRIIWFTGDGPFGIPAEGLTLRDGYVISGGTQQSGGTNTVIEYSSDLVSDQPVIVDGLYMSNPSYANSIYRYTGTAGDSKPLLKNVRKPSNVALTQGPAAGAKWVNRDGTYHGFSAV